MSELICSLLAALMAIVITWTVVCTGVIDDCGSMGMSRIGGRVFECSEVHKQ